MATTTAAVVITSPTTIPLEDDVVISWDINNQEILGFDVRIGTAEGLWDVFNGRLGKMVREVRLPGLPDDLVKLFLEFGYTVPSPDVDERSENILISEKPIPIWRKP